MTIGQLPAGATFQLSDLVAIETGGQTYSGTLQQLFELLYPISVEHGGTGASTAAGARENLGLGNVDNVRQYSADNPPPYPVPSVNGRTGPIQLSAADVGLAPVAVTVAGTTNVTINDNQSYKIGRLVVVNVRFTLSAAIGANSTVLQGLPAPATTLPLGSGVAAMASNRADVPFSLVAGGQIVPTESASARMYIASGCYLTD